MIAVAVVIAFFSAYSADVACDLSPAVPGGAVTFCATAHVDAPSHPLKACVHGPRRFIGAVAASLPRVFSTPTIRAGAGAVLVAAGVRGSSTSAWDCRRVLQPLQRLRRASARVFACVRGSAEEREARQLMAYRKMPSVVTWVQPRCLMQGRKKERLLQAWVMNTALEPAGKAGEAGSVEAGENCTALQREDGKTLWTGVGCNESEFRLLLAHVTGNASESETAPVDELYVDLGDPQTRADLRNRWSARKLVLKDKSFKKSMAADESLVGDIKGYLTRMHEFQNESMTAAELLEWLEASWLPTASPPPADAAAAPRASVAGLMFAQGRGINETGRVLGPMLHWFRVDYPYYHQRCLACGHADTTRLGTLRSAPHEEKFASGRTEVMHCPQCLAYSRFPRFNQLRKVLLEQRGRCGEYSMVLYHLMRALGYSTRWVVDWTDHVWVEVLVEGEWVHIDPCEAAYNDKRMYVGWGKKHTYVVAFRAEGEADIEFEDVTAAYADNMTQVRKRRDLSDADLDKALELAVTQWNSERDESVKLLARSDCLGRGEALLGVGLPQSVWLRSPCSVCVCVRVCGAGGESRVCSAHWSALACSPSTLTHEPSDAKGQPLNLEPSTTTPILDPQPPTPNPQQHCRDLAI
jgi:hypothetical protein